MQGRSRGSGRHLHHQPRGLAPAPAPALRRRTPARHRAAIPASRLLRSPLAAAGSSTPRGRHVAPQSRRCSPGAAAVAAKPRRPSPARRRRGRAPQSAPAVRIAEPDPAPQQRPKKEPKPTSVRGGATRRARSSFQLCPSPAHPKTAVVSFVTSFLSLTLSPPRCSFPLTPSLTRLPLNKPPGVHSVLLSPAQQPHG